MIRLVSVDVLGRRNEIGAAKVPPPRTANAAAPYIDVFVKFLMVVSYVFDGDVAARDDAFGVFIRRRREARSWRGPSSAGISVAWPP